MKYISRMLLVVIFSVSLCVSLVSHAKSTQYIWLPFRADSLVIVTQGDEANGNHSGLGNPMNPRWGHDFIVFKEDNPEIYPSFPGIILEINKDPNHFKYFGKFVVVRSKSKDISFDIIYAHLNSIDHQLTTGMNVSFSTKLGIMGNTGMVSPKPSSQNPTAGTHLHEEMFDDWLKSGKSKSLKVTFFESPKKLDKNDFIVSQKPS